MSVCHFVYSYKIGIISVGFKWEFGGYIKNKLYVEKKYIS